MRRRRRARGEEGGPRGELGEASALALDSLCVSHGLDRYAGGDSGLACICKDQSHSDESIHITASLSERNYAEGGKPHIQCCQTLVVYTERHVCL